MVAQNFGDSVPVGTLGDVNFDGAVNFGDLVLVAQDFGNTIPNFGNIVPSSGPGPATLSTRSLDNLTQLVVTGTSGNDSILVTQSGNTFTVVSNGTTQTISGSFGELDVHAGSGGSTITVDSSVNISTLIYGGAGADTIYDNVQGPYTAVVTIGGGNDTVQGNGINTNYWGDTGDTLLASASEISAGLVNRVSAFYQPWSSDPTNPDYVPLSLQGQNLRDPLDTGTPVQYNESLFGTGPVMTDINQGSINDCYFLATIQSLAYSSPAKLESLAVDLGDGTYAVRFSQYGVSTFVRVDGDMAGWGVHNSNGSLWPMVFEKAYAFFRTQQNSYSSLNTGFSGDVYSNLGIANSYLFMSSPPAMLASQMSTALATGKGSHPADAAHPQCVGAAHRQPCLLARIHHPLRRHLDPHAKKSLGLRWRRIRQRRQ